MREWWAGRALLIGALSGFIACAEAGRGGSADADGGAVYGGTAVIAGPGDLDNANSLVATQRYTQELLREALFLPLVRYDSALDYAPALARSWEMLADTGVILHLRDDVRWHDGQRTTAEDVAFTFTRAKDPRTGFPNIEFFERWSGIEVIDSFTVRFTFEPHAEALAGLPFMPIMPRHALDTVPPDRMAQTPFNRAPIGNGPFRFVEYRANDRWVFEANPDFPEELGGRPYLDRLVWRVIPDGTAQATEGRTGNADVLLAPRAEDFAALDAHPQLRGAVRDSRQYGMIAWNGRRPPLNDARVRRALTTAIDRQQIIAALRQGHGQVALGPIGPFHWAFNERVQPPPFSPDTARALLHQAGIQDRDGNGILETPAGRDFEIELKYQSGSGMNTDLAQLVQANLSAIGVRTRLRPLDFNVLVRDLTTPDRNFDAVIIGWESDIRLNVRDLFHTDAMAGPYQFASYSNPEVDSIIDAVALETDRDRAGPLLERFQEIMRDEQPWSFLYYYPDLYVISERLRGVEMDIRSPFITVGKWWIPRERQTQRAAPPRNDSAGRSPSPVPEPAR